MQNPLIRTLLITIICIIGGLILTWGGLRIYGTWHDDWSGYTASTMISDGWCNVAVAPVVGDIIAYAGADKDGYSTESDLPVSTNPDDFSYFLRQAEADPYVLGVLVRIDSSGGSPVGGEVIANALRRSILPSVALLGDVAASSGYLVASGANTVIASPFSDVGSIGITMSYLENTRQNERDGLSFVSLSSGQFKDYMSPDKPLTTEERVLLERDLDIWHTYFVELVSENRGLPLEHVAALADGSSMPGSLALENGLVDTLGDQETARAWFAQELGLTPAEIVFCE
jgi:protease-4